MTQTHVRLGFEVGTGEPVDIPLRHMVITGQTQEAGKTTALEALVARADLSAVTFITKRGEKAFGGGRRIPPFFRERADWVFVSSLIDATMGEKNKLLRAWLMKVCRNTKTLADVQRNVRKAKADARGFSESIYTEIEGYLDLVVPQLAQLPPQTKVVIGPGLNVMDLALYSTELQALVIRSVLEHVYEQEEGVITVIPEAWEFLPEGRGSPVKREAEALIRKGAGLKNYVWLDSQDLAGVWKLAVRAAPVVLVGVQREANEIKRTLANIPAGIAKPTAKAVATLGLGQFFACHGTHVIKTYVQPSWMEGSVARGVATGDIAEIPTYLFAASQAVAARIALKEEAVNAEEAAALRAENVRLDEENHKLRNDLHALQLRMKKIERDLAPTAVGGGGGGGQSMPAPLAGGGGGGGAAGSGGSVSISRPAPRTLTDWPLDTPNDLARIYDLFKERLINEAPQVLRVLAQKPEIVVEVERYTIEAKGDTLRGRIARLLATNFFDGEGVTGVRVQAELARRGKDPGPGNTYAELDSLAALGFLTIEQGKDERGRPRKKYVAVPGMKVQIVEAA